MKKILIIEDDKAIVNTLFKALTDSGFDAIAAEDAYQGTKFAYENNPDLIILDLMLPAGGGETTLKNIRLSTKTKNIPVVVLTGVQDDEVRDRVIKQGVSVYLQKPVELEKLILAIKNSLASAKNI